MILILTSDLLVLEGYRLLVDTTCAGNMQHFLLLRRLRTPESPAHSLRQHELPALRRVGHEGTPSGLKLRQCVPLLIPWSRKTSQSGRETWFRQRQRSGSAIIKSNGPPRKNRKALCRYRIGAAAADTTCAGNVQLEMSNVLTVGSVQHRLQCASLEYPGNPCLAKQSQPMRMERKNWYTRSDFAKALTERGESWQRNRALL